MNLMLASFAFVAAAACAALMGFSIQRGATCTVAAMDEIVNRRRCHRLFGFLEASLWVTGGLLIARAVDALPRMSSRRVRVGSGCTCVDAVVSGAMCAPISHNPASLTITYASLRCARPPRIAFTSQPSSAMPASNRSSIK